MLSNLSKAVIAILISVEVQALSSEIENGDYRPSHQLTDCLITEKSIEACREIPENEFTQFINVLRKRIEAYSNGDTRTIRSDTENAGLWITGAGMGVQLIPWQLEFINEFISIPDKFIKIVEHWAPRIGGKIASTGGTLFGISLFMPEDAQAETIDEIMAEPERLALFIGDSSKNLDYAIDKSKKDPLVRKNLLMLSMAAAVKSQ